jgi:hypothetical protein
MVAFKAGQNMVLNVQSQEHQLRQLRAVKNNFKEK